jgi:hypothetical protein
MQRTRVWMGPAGAHRAPCRPRTQAWRRKGESRSTHTRDWPGGARAGGRCAHTRDLDGSGGSPPRPGQLAARSLLPARWADGLLECGRVDPHWKPKRYFASDVATLRGGRMVFSSRGGSTLGRNRNRYFANDVPAERRSSHASTTRFAMPASAALPQARGS